MGIYYRGNRAAKTSIREINGSDRIVNTSADIAFDNLIGSNQFKRRHNRS